MPTVNRRPPILALLTVCLAAGVVADPVGTVTAARQGLSLWWSAVLPSLLPFFILNDLLQALGVVDALGVLLEPAMRPLFRLSGASGFGLVAGFTAGFPAGARTAAALTQANLCTRDEGSHLAAFTNAAGPLFLTGVTAVSLFHCPAAALPLVVAHFGSALLSGVLLARWPWPLPASSGRRKEQPERRGYRLRRAWDHLEQGSASAPALGHLLGSVVREAGGSVLLVGGFIVFFSVLLGFAERSGLLNWVASPLMRLAAAAGISPDLAKPVVAGMFEVTNGLSRLAAAPGPLHFRLAVASGLLGWSGLSVHAQAAAVSAPAGLSYRRFLASKVMQSILGPLLFLAVWPLATGPTSHPSVVPTLPGPLAHVKAGTMVFLLSLATLGALSALIAGTRWFAGRLARRVSAIWIPRVPRRQH